jgi:phage-related protein (TIGR01555 family)
MNLFGWFRRRRPAIVTEVTFPADREPLTSPPLKITAAALEALAMGGSNKPGVPGPMPNRPENPFRGLPTPPPGVRPAADPVPKGMAMDDAQGSAIGGQWGAWATGGLWGEGLFFPGYPYLAELAQRPEYRNIVETTAEEMTRKWIELESTGKGDKSDRIKEIEDAMKRLGMREAFHRAAQLDGFFGMGMIHFRMRGANNSDELSMPLVLTSEKIEKGSLEALVPVDPTWVSPVQYNSTDPLRDDFFKPTIWYVMGKRVHTSRLMIFRSREVPDILKASYNFGGLSLSQMAKPYVDNWLRTRQSVSDLLHAFTTWVLKTNMGAYLQDASALMSRLAAFVLGRDNKGLLLIDKESEELDNVSAPLGTLDKLQAQAQEQMAFPAQEPILKFVGYTPTGLGETSEVIIRSWYDRVHAKQEKVFGHNVTDCLKVIQLSEFGEIDPEITFRFVDLWELDEAGREAVQKIKADTAEVLLSASVVDTDEVRQAFADDPESMFHGLKGPAPEPPEMTMPGEEEDGSTGGDPANGIGGAGARGRTNGANSGV